MCPCWRCGGLKYFRIALAAVRHMDKMIRIWSGNYIAMPYVELVITTKCSLRCRSCSNLMQYYNKENIMPYDVGIDVNIKASMKLLELVDQINNFTVLGGEPFLYKDLHLLIAYLVEQKKIRKITIITNGTIVPSEEQIYSCMQNKNVHIVISDYGELSRRKAALVEKLQYYGISFEVRYSDGHWQDFGDLQPRNRSGEELSKQFQNCKTQCKSMLNGKLHYCFRSTHVMDLGKIQDDPNEYLDLFDGSTLDRKRRLRRILYAKMDFIKACDYCDYATESPIYVKPGIQLLKGEILK